MENSQITFEEFCNEPAFPLIGKFVRGNDGTKFFHTEKSSGLTRYEYVLCECLKGYASQLTRDSTAPFQGELSDKADSIAIEFLKVMYKKRVRK